MRAIKSGSEGTPNLTSREALESFRKAAEAFTKKATRSKAQARKTLIDEGILTKTSKLSKNYR
mgnify:CR=1 FL=1